jgi:hypothetical protein
MRVHVSYIYDTETKTFESALGIEEDEDLYAEARIDAAVTPIGINDQGRFTAEGDGSRWRLQAGEPGSLVVDIIKYDAEPTDQLANIALRVAAELATRSD